MAGRPPGADLDDGSANRRDDAAGFARRRGRGGDGALWYLAAAALVGLILDGFGLFSLLLAAALLFAAWVVLTPGPTRLQRLSRPLLGRIRGMLPTLSDTEAEALKSGSVDWDGELFSGRPNWERLIRARPAQLSEEVSRIRHKCGFARLAAIGHRRKERAVGFD